MNEAILSYAWKYRCYQAIQLLTTSGFPVTVLKPGKENRDAGPDFFLAEIRLGDTHWVGNVEIHVKSSDWELHRHQQDPAYRNVILHVVYDHDKEILVGGTPLPTLELKSYLEKEFLKRFQKLQESRFSLIPCEAQFAGVDSFHVDSFIRTLLIERLGQKTEQLTFLYNRNRQDLRETFYQWLFIGFGQKVNKDGFHALSHYVPLPVSAKYFTSVEQLSALLFGVSGLLTKSEQSEEEYTAKLRTEYSHLKNKHQLSELETGLWKFMRMRPSGFPTIRIAQLAELLCSKELYDALFNCELSLSLVDRLSTIKLNAFWDNRYSFDRVGPIREKHIGHDFSRHLLLNVLIPFKAFRENLTGTVHIQEIEDLWQQLEAENNVITRRMTNVGFKNQHSGHSQGLVQLYNLYCEPKKCLLCKIGYQILRN